MVQLFIILTTVFLPVLSGCATVYNSATNQKEFIVITTPIEVAIGDILANKFSQDFKINKDVDRVNKIGKLVAGVSDRKDLDYHFNVIEDESLNAFTAPGGYIYINSGVLKKVNDDELACVIGHEVGHISAWHIAKKLQAQIGYDILMNLLVRSSKIEDLQKAASISYDLIILGYSREDELAADKLGAKYAYEAGYDPFAMISFLKKLEGIEDTAMGPIFLRSHPYISDRIKELERQIPGFYTVLQNESNNIEVKPTTVPKSQPLRVMCHSCKRIFSGTTNYCPYDGIKLQ